MVRRRTYDNELYAHFVTFACYRRRKLLDHDHPKRLLLGSLNEQLAIQTAKCIGFVVMPDHVHAMIWFPEPRQLSRFVQGWKRRSSFRIRAWYRDAKFRYLDSDGQSDPFWQERYHAFEIESESKLDEKLNYMHLNPVRAGLVERAADWRWSSARHYVDGRSVGVPIEWVS